MNKDDIPEDAYGSLAEIPRINIAFYCESKELYDVARQSAVDRRLKKSKISVYSGGVTGAVDAYRDKPTPNLLILESHLSTLELLVDLEGLAEVCDENTQVIIAGKTNDVDMYRELIKHGISEYIILPITPNLLIQCISRLYCEEDNVSLAPTISFIGAAGGVGTSVVAQNFAFSMAHKHEMDTFFLDLDTAYGSAQMNWNMGAVKSIKDVVELKSVDDNIITSIRSNVINNLFMVGSPIDPSFDMASVSEADERLDEVIIGVQKMHDIVICDVPHGAIDVYKKTAILNSTYIYIVTVPTLRGIRNTIVLIDILEKMRPNDAKPRIIISQMGMPDAITFDEKAITENFERPADCYVEYSPDVVERALAEGVPLLDIDENAQIVEDIESCINNFFGKTLVRDKKKLMLPSFIANILKG